MRTVGLPRAAAAGALLLTLVAGCTGGPEAGRGQVAGSGSTVARSPSTAKPVEAPSITPSLATGSVRRTEPPAVRPAIDDLVQAHHRDVSHASYHETFQHRVVAGGDLDRRPGCGRPGRRAAVRSRPAVLRRGTHRSASGRAGGLGSGREVCEEPRGGPVPERRKAQRRTTTRALRRLRQAVRQGGGRCLRVAAGQVRTREGLCRRCAAGERLPVAAGAPRGPAAGAASTTTNPGTSSTRSPTRAPGARLGCPRRSDSAGRTGPGEAHSAG